MSQIYAKNDKFIVTLRKRR